MSWSSVCQVIGGPKRLAEDQVTVYGEQAGLKFIKLRHKLGSSRGSQSVRGFQKTTITRRETDNGHVSWKVYHSRDEDGNDIQGRVNLVFYNELKNGILYAYLPDTEFNRNRLTSTFYPGAMWEISDKDIEKEIRALEEKIKENPAPKVSEKKDAALDELKRENEELRSLINDALEDRDDAEKERDEAKMSEQEIKEKVLPYIDKGDELVPVGLHRHAKLLTQRYIAEFKLLAKEEIEKKHSELIEDLKKTKRNYWLSAEYHDAGIRAEIDNFYKDGIEGFLTAKWRRPWNEHGPIISDNHSG